MNIEKGIPVPPAYSSCKAYKWLAIALEMEAGDSVFFETHKAASSLARALAKRGRKNTCRKIDGGYRVWRIS